MVDHAIYSDRAELYSRHRPSYPTGVLDALRDAGSLRASCVVADIGSGTGIFTRLLLDSGNPVFAVEPDPTLRARRRTTCGATPDSSPWPDRPNTRRSHPEASI